jgi:hypothetical protein
MKYSNIYVVHIVARLRVYQHKIRGACELDSCSACARTGHVLIVRLKFCPGSTCTICVNVTYLKFNVNFVHRYPKATLVQRDCVTSFFLTMVFSS